MTKSKTAVTPDETSHGLGIERESGKKNGLLFSFFRRFWVKEPRHSETEIIAKNRYTSLS